MMSAALSNAGVTFVKTIGTSAATTAHAQMRDSMLLTIRNDKLNNVLVSLETVCSKMKLTPANYAKLLKEVFAILASDKTAGYVSLHSGRTGLYICLYIEAGTNYKDILIEFMLTNKFGYDITNSAMETLK